MILILRPPGRGNWKPITVTVEGDRAHPLFIQVGQRLFLGGRTFRICKVIP
jgi:hypothetical protein